MTQKKQKKCNIAVLYEQHNMPIPTLLAKLVISRYHPKGFIFLGEELSDGPLGKTREAFCKFFQRLQNEEFAARVFYSLGFNIKWVQVDFIETQRFKCELLTLMEQRRIKYSPIDLSSPAKKECEKLGEACLTKRDDNFVKRIKGACKTSDSILFLVGYGHEKVVLDLINDSYNITGFVPSTDGAPDKIRKFVEAGRESAHADAQHHFGADAVRKKANLDANFDCLRIFVDNPKHFKLLECGFSANLDRCVETVIGALSHHGPDTEL